MESSSPISRIQFPILVLGPFAIALLLISFIFGCQSGYLQAANEGPSNFAPKSGVPYDSSCTSGHSTKATSEAEKSKPLPQCPVPSKVSRGKAGQDCCEKAS